MKVGVIRTALKTINILNKLRWISNLYWIRQNKFIDYFLDFHLGFWGVYCRTGESKMRQMNLKHSKNWRKSLSHPLQGRNFIPELISLSLVSEVQPTPWLCSCLVWAVVRCCHTSSPSRVFFSLFVGSWLSVKDQLVMWLLILIFNLENVWSTSFISLFCAAKLPQG